jgi:Uma2 family endonuclease
MQTQKATTLEKYDPFEGEIIVADNLSYEEFLRLADGRHAEWYEGKVILVMANSILHQRIVALLSFIFRIYFDRQPIGQHILASFSMRTEEDLPRREPDIVIVLN